jgi:hypothetical protein
MNTKNTELAAAHAHFEATRAAFDLALKVADSAYRLARVRFENAIDAAYCAKTREETCSMILAAEAAWKIENTIRNDTLTVAHAALEAARAPAAALALAAYDANVAARNA